MKNCLIVQHVAAEAPFAVADALHEAGVDLEICRVFADDPLPSAASGFDGVVVMGGPMSATSDSGFATRRAEIQLLADALHCGVPTLGVCLGAQLLAAAGNAEVYQGRSGPEIGWGPVDLLSTCQDDLLFAGLPRQLTVLHWHGDTFDLPSGATRLMSNSNYVNQAFRIGARGWGLQFHLEVTAVALEGFLQAFADEAALAARGESGIRETASASLASLQGARTLVLARFATLSCTEPPVDGLRAPDESSGFVRNGDPCHADSRSSLR